MHDKLQQAIDRLKSLSHDQTLFAIGFGLFLFYALFHIYILAHHKEFEEVGKHTLLLIAKDMDLGKLDDWNPVLFIFIYFFIISVISGFLGIPIARGVANIIERKGLSYYNEKKKIVDNEVKNVWGKVIERIEEYQITFLIRKIKRLKMMDGFVIAREKNHLPQVRVLRKVSNVLRDIGEHKEFKCEEQTNSILIAARKHIRSMKFSVSVYRGFILLCHIGIPLIISLVIASGTDYLIEINHQNDYEGIFLLFFASGLIVISYPFTYAVFSILGLFSIKVWRANSTATDDFIFRIFSVFLFWMVCGLIITLGINILAGGATFVQSNIPFIGGLDFNEDALKKLIISFISMLFPFFDAPQGSSFIEYLDKTSALVIQLTFVVSFSYVIYSTVHYVVTQYEKYFYDEYVPGFSIPPELAKIFGYFLVFIFSTSLVYASVVGYLTAGVKSSDPTPPLGFSDFLPYSIFLAFMGAVLAVSTRELLENYFTGLALKVDPPFEEGDMVQIGKSGIMEVKHIGFRAVTFYAVETNAHKHASFKELSSLHIDNYTYPTLDYRREIHLYISAGNKINSSHLSQYPVTQRAEMLLLLSAFLVKGVKRPNTVEIEKKLRGIDIDDNSQLITALDKEVWGVDYNDEQTSDIKKRIRKKLFIDGIQKLMNKTHDESEIEELKSEFKEVLADIVRNNILFYKNKQKSLITVESDCEYKEVLYELAENAERISYGYFMLAFKLWSIKEKLPSLSLKRSIDVAAIELLNAPRVRSSQEVDGGGNARWNMSLAVTLELAEQSDEIMHHINISIDRLFNCFIGKSVEVGEIKEPINT